MHIVTKEQKRFLGSLLNAPAAYNSETVEIGCFLVESGFAEFVYSSDGATIGFRLNEAGKSKLSSLKQEKSEKRRSEVRVWLTFIISVLAFILSALSLLWQVYSWQEKESQKQAGATTEAHASSYIQ